MVIHALTVGHNESGRYLEDFLRWTNGFVESHLFYDDRSTDDTTAIAEQWCEVVVRDSDDPGFMDNEGIFRENAYRHLLGRASEDDWVLSLDCDEFLVGIPDERSALESVVSLALANDCDAVHVPIPEVFSLEGGVRVRTDGWWGTLGGPRLFKLFPFREFNHSKMGGGSAPKSLTTYANHDAKIHLLHFGYANLEDRLARYDRYSSLSNNGHNPKHIRSILDEPTLQYWSEPLPSWLKQSA